MIDTANLEIRKVAIVVANKMICPENEQSDGKAGHADGFLVLFHTAGRCLRF